MAPEILLLDNEAIDDDRDLVSESV